ncbi:MAG TPA: hypothetical protein VGZ22_03690, partial [Isosphaeraceae bacterium]|nr:hypothetical protein [Isosphaeraceae bacterium]
NSSSGSWLQKLKPLVGGGFRNANRATVVGQPISLGEPDSACWRETEHTHPKRNRRLLRPFNAV